MNGSPAVSETDFVIAREERARILIETKARCNAAITQARESVHRSYEALAAATERLRHAQEVQEAARQRRQQLQRATGYVSSAGDGTALSPSIYLWEAEPSHWPGR
jgi:hypothetical protein